MQEDQGLNECRFKGRSAPVPRHPVDKFWLTRAKAKISSRLDTSGSVTARLHAAMATATVIAQVAAKVGGNGVFPAQLRLLLQASPLTVTMLGRPKSVTVSGMSL